MKNKFSFLKLTLLVVFGTLFFSTCKEIGMGGRVEIYAPTMKVTYPNSGTVPIRRSFVVKGEAYDDTGVKNVTLKFKNIVTGKKYSPKLTERQLVNKGIDSATGKIKYIWSYTVVNEQLKNSDGSLKYNDTYGLQAAYPIPDGDYDMIVTTEDKGGKTTEIKHRLKIDNTPPVLILDTPSTFLKKNDIFDSSNITKYGAELKIYGTVGEAHELPWMWIDTVTGLEEDVKKDLTVKPYTYKLAESISKSGDIGYEALMTAQNNDTDSIVKTNIFVADNARIYDYGKTSDEDNEKGNVSKFYYTSSHLFKEALKGVSTEVIAAYFAGNKGNALGNDFEKKVAEFYNNTNALDFLSQHKIVVQEKESTFTLDPDKRAGLIMPTATLVSTNGDDSVLNDITPSFLVENSKLVVELVRNKDDNNILKENTLSFFQNTESGAKINITLHPGTTVSELASYEDVGKVELDKTSLTNDDFSVTNDGRVQLYFNLPTGPGKLTPGYYSVKITGSDASGNQFIPYDSSTKGFPNSMYVLRFKSATGSPIVYIDPVNEWKNGDFDLYAKVNNLSIGTVHYNIGNSADISSSTMTSVSGTSYKATISTVDLIQGENKIAVYAENESGDGSNIDVATIKVDTRRPEELTLTQDLPAGSVLDSKTYKFTGTASDATSGIKKITCQVWDKSLNSGAGDWTGNFLADVDATSNTWTAYVNFKQDDKNKLRVIVEDNAGNTSEDEFGPYTVNSKSPEINEAKLLDSTTELGDFASETYLLANKAGLTLEIKAQSAIPTKVNIKSVAVTVADKTVDATGPTGAGTGTWTANLSSALSGITGDETKSITITVTDENDRITELVNRTLQIDKKPPKITFTGSLDGKTVNKTINITGLSSDNLKMKTTKVTIGSTSKTFEDSASYNWTIPFDSKTVTDGSEVIVQVEASDAAGNTATKSITLRVDQDTDKPQIVIRSLDKIKGGTLKGTTRITGTITDDDGPISSFKIHDQTNEHTITVKAGGEWSFDVPAPDGDKTLDFIVLDKAGETFNTTGSLKPRLYAESLGATAVEDSATFKLDTKDPDIEDLLIYDNGNANYVRLASLTHIKTKDGGKFSNAKFQIKAKDSNGIEKVKVEIIQGSITTDELTATKKSGSAGVEEIWETTNKDLDSLGFENSTAEILITVVDKCNLISIYRQTITVDNEPPVVNVVYPAFNTAGDTSIGSQTGEIEMRGNISDNGSGAVQEIKYIIGNDEGTPPPSTASAWRNDADIDGLSWKFTIPSSITNKANIASHATVNAGNNKLYDLPVYFLVKDNAGNEDVVVKTIIIDPNGDIPEVTVSGVGEVGKPTTVGGPLNINGTVKTPKNGSVQEIYIQVTKKDTMPSDAEFNADNNFTTAGSTINYGTTNGKKIENYVPTSFNWNVIINKDGELNPMTGDELSIWYRVRGVNQDGNPGPWSEPIQLKVNPNAPRITDVRVCTGDNIESNVIGPNNFGQTRNMWISGNDLYLVAKLTHKSGIHSVEIKSELTEANVTLEDSAIEANSMFTTLPTPENGYRMAIPLKTTALATLDNSFDITVTIVNNTTGSIAEMTTYMTWTFRYDNEKPIAGIGERKHASNESITAGSGTFTDSLLVSSAEDFVGMLVLANEESKKITAFDSTTGTITIESAFTKSSKGYIIYKPGEFLWKLSGTNSRLDGVACDLGSGIKTIEVQIDGTSTWTTASITNDVGNFVTWYTDKLDLRGIEDGLRTVKCKAVDKAGNEFNTSSQIKIKNNAVTVSKVSFGTDLNYDANIENVANATEVKLQTVQNQHLNPKTRNSSADIDSDFVFKNPNSKVEVEVSGGSSNYTYKLSTKDGNEVKSGIFNGTVCTIGLVSDDFTKIGQSYSGTDYNKKELILTIWRDAEGLSASPTDPWLEAGKTVVNIKVFVDTVDRQKPIVNMVPLTAGSVYDNAGHIDVGKDLPTTEFSDSTGVKDRDDKVSGKIKLTGTVTDDQIIKELYASIDSFTLAGSAVTGNHSTDSSIKKIAVYDVSTGTWKVKSNNLATNGWQLTVSGSFDVSTGHTVTWELDWDTEKLGIGLDKEIKIFAKDSNNYSDELPASKNKVDVVPYITEIQTSLYENAGKEFATAVNGYYSVRENETIKLFGYNLVSNPSVTLGSTPLTVGAKVTASGKSYYPVTIATGSASGKLDVKVTASSTTIKALNNINGNPYTLNATTGEMELNEKYLNNAKANNANKYISDDIGVYVWKLSSLVNNNDLTSPMLKINSSGKYFMSYGKGIPAMVVNTNGVETTIDYSYNKFHNTAVAYDESDNVYAVATNTDRISNDSAKFSFYSRAVSKSGGNGYYISSWTGKSRLESAYNEDTSKYDINRVRYPKLHVTGTTTEAKVYMAYFDGNHSERPVKFRYGTVNGSNTFTGGMVDGATGSDSSTVDGAPNVHIVANRTTTHQGGDYTAVGVTPDGVAVIAWYDATNRSLIYSYNETPNSVVANGGVWQTNAKVIDSNYAGWYVDLTVDPDGGIHIAYYNTGKGDLKYAYLSSYNAEPEVVTVDSYMSTGTQISINTRREESGKHIPYISYYNPSFARTSSAVKVAWRVTTAVLKDGANDTSFTGNWEVMTIPAVNIPNDAPVCIGVPTTGATNNTDKWNGGNVVLGFMTDKAYEVAVLKK